MTDARYQLTRTATNELGEILAYIAARDGVDRALHVHDKFVEAFEHLATMPRTGFRRPQLTGESVRWGRVFDWLVIYEPEDAPVTILRVLHGAREVNRLLRPDE